MEEKHSRKREFILKAVQEALDEYEYSQFTIEDIAIRAGVGKSTIYRWWKHKSDLVFDAFKLQTESIFILDFDESLKFNLNRQLIKLSLALTTGVGRALLVVMAEHREAAGNFFKEYLLPRREQTRKLIGMAIERKELVPDYAFEMMLDTLYATIHYQIIFFNRVPDQTYIKKLIDFVIAPVLVRHTSS